MDYDSLSIHAIGMIPKIHPFGTHIVMMWLYKELYNVQPVQNKCGLDSYYGRNVDAALYTVRLLIHLVHFYLHCCEATS